jgi:predicted DNA-binding transcriptional regulator YafY
MTRPTSRVLALLELLQGGGTRRVGDLAERLGVDERTVRRYAEHLVELDIPVRSVRGRYGGYRLAPGYRMPPLMLTDDEAVAMAIGLVVGQRAGLAPESIASESALAKLRRCSLPAWPIVSAPCSRPRRSPLQRVPPRRPIPISC